MVGGWRATAGGGEGSVGGAVRRGGTGGRGGGTAAFYCRGDGGGWGVEMRQNGSCTISGGC
eukprot:2052493-Prorocentrum_lima.AAC.1